MIQGNDRGMLLLTFIPGLEARGWFQSTYEVGNNNISFCQTTCSLITPFCAVRWVYGIGKKKIDLPSLI